MAEETKTEPKHHLMKLSIIDYVAAYVTFTQAHNVCVDSPHSTQKTNFPDHRDRVTLNRLRRLRVFSEEYDKKFHNSCSSFSDCKNILVRSLDQLTFTVGNGRIINNINSGRVIPDFEQYIYKEIPDLRDKMIQETSPKTGEHMVNDR